MPETQTPSSIAAATGGLPLGGTSTALVNLASGLREFGERLPIVCLSDTNDHEADFRKVDADVRVLRDRRLIYEDRLAWGYKQLRSIGPSMVLACLGAESFELLRLVPSGVIRVGLIQADHPGPYATAASYSPWLDAMVGVSNEISETIKLMPEFQTKPVHTIPYGIHFRDSKYRSPRTPFEPLRAIYVGRLIEEQKRVSRLAELANRLESAGSPVRLTIVGSGPQEAELRARLSAGSIATVVGEIPNDHIPDLLLQHDVFILLSDYEGLPLSLLEAMGYGLVPVVSDLPSGIQQAVPEGTGVLVPIGDIEAAAAALKMLAEDPIRVVKLANAAQAHARSKFGAKRMARDFLDVIKMFPAGSKLWPTRVQIPPPLGLNPFVFSGLPRRIRRLARRWVPLRRG